MTGSTRIVAVGGFASNVGKTTLACRLIDAMPGWEAIKVTKGHYRSCGKDPETCCVSHLLTDAPLVLSGRDANYVPGKDTARYWDSGAANVHWVIATKQQVADGVREALGRVSASCPGVVIEGTGFVVDVPVDFVVMVARTDATDVKQSARRVVPMSDALFVSGPVEDRDRSVGTIRSMLDERSVACDLPSVVFEDEFDRLCGMISAQTAPRNRSR
jgi:molybdopterin-guanine dinucleotide biosynthesis protein